MRADRISAMIVKNVGNYEGIRYSIDYILEETDDHQVALKVARDELEKAYKLAYPTAKPNEVLIEKDELTESHPRFNMIAKSLFNGTTTVDKIRESYKLDIETIKKLTETIRKLKTL